MSLSLLPCVSYRSFSQSSENIGDLTAKGEAQIAVVDLIGMAVGVLLSKLDVLDSSRSLLTSAAAYVCLTSLELYFAYREVRRLVGGSVQFILFLLPYNQYYAPAYPIADIDIDVNVYVCGCFSVVFHTLNFERASIILKNLFASNDICSLIAAAAAATSRDQI